MIKLQTDNDMSGSQKQLRCLGNENKLIMLLDSLTLFSFSLNVLGNKSSEKTHKKNKSKMKI